VVELGVTCPFLKDEKKQLRDTNCHGFGLDDLGSNPGWDRDFSLRYRIQTGSASL
jgi:hypothetical protein